MICCVRAQPQIVLDALCYQRGVSLRNTCRILTQMRLKHMGKAWNIWQEITRYEAWLETSTLEGVYYIAAVLQRTTVRSNRNHLATAWWKWCKLLTVGNRHQLEEQSSSIMSKGKTVISAFLIKNALSSLNRRSLGRCFHHWLEQDRRLTLARPAIKALQRLLKVKMMNTAWRQWIRASDCNAFNFSIQAMRHASSLIMVHQKCTHAVESLRSAFQLWKSATERVRAADFRLLLATSMAYRLADRLSTHRMRHAFDAWVKMTKRSAYLEMQSMSGSYFMVHTIQHILSRIRRRSLARAMRTLRNHCDVIREPSAVAVLNPELQDITRYSFALMVIGPRLIQARILRLGTALRSWQRNVLLYSTLTPSGTLSMSQTRSPSPCISVGEKRQWSEGQIFQHIPVRGSHTLAALSIYRVRRRRLLCLALFVWKWCSHSETDLSRRIGRELALAMSGVKEDWPLPLQRLFHYSRRHYYHAIDSAISKWRRTIFLDKEKEYVDTPLSKAMDLSPSIGTYYSREEVKRSVNYSDDGATISPLKGNVVGADNDLQIYQQVPSRHLQLSSSKLDRSSFGPMTERLGRTGGKVGRSKTMKWDEVVVHNEKVAVVYQEQPQHRYEYQHSPTAAPMQRSNISLVGSHTNDEVEFHKTMNAATSRVLFLKQQQKLRIVVIASLRRQSYDWHISPLSCCFR